MPLIIPPGFCQASFVLTGAVGTQPYVTTLGVDTSGYGGDFVAAANYLGSAYATAFAPMTNQDLQLDRVTLFVGSDGSSGSVDSTTSPYPMASAASMGPTAMSVIARKNTNDIGRRGRGRMFLPGSAAEGEVTESGSLTTTFTEGVNDILVTFYELLATPVDPEDALPPVLFHGSAPADPTPILGFSAAPLVGWIGGRIR